MRLNKSSKTSRRLSTANRIKPQAAIPQHRPEALTLAASAATCFKSRRACSIYSVAPLNLRISEISTINGRKPRRRQVNHIVVTGKNEVIKKNRF
ncbi:hypothetical protein I7I53_05503 [Histoplasma capsulatum var. duboisii H88]|nr:hypothetical protein I7I53_05503 [Histoplasma capsulatum var. duboisii H88]